MRSVKRMRDTISELQYMRLRVDTAASNAKKPHRKRHLHSASFRISTAIAHIKASLRNE